MDKILRIDVAGDQPRVKEEPYAVRGGVSAVMGSKGIKPIILSESGFHNPSLSVLIRDIKVSIHIVNFSFKWSNYPDSIRGF